MSTRLRGGVIPNPQTTCAEIGNPITNSSQPVSLAAHLIKALDKGSARLHARVACIAQTERPPCISVVQRGQVRGAWPGQLRAA